MTENDRQLVKTLESKTKIVQNKYGQNILVKEIPDSDVDGDLDSRVLAVLEQKKAAAKDSPSDITIAEMRKSMGWPNQDVTDGSITVSKKTICGKNGDIPTLVYKPEGNKVRPCIVFFHGGGFFGGTLKCVDNPCRCIAFNSDAVVISVDYRLAPEDPFPKGADDCFDVVTWVYNHPEEFGIDNKKIGVCGDSAGGNLAAVCTLKDRDMGSNMIKYQALLYPVTNVSALDCEEYQWNQNEYNVQNHKDIIDEAINAIGNCIDLLVKTYLQGDKELGRNPYVSPIFADDVIGTPYTLIIDAEYDYLRIENEGYGRKLAKAGTIVKMIRYNGSNHAFMDKIGEFPQAEDAMKEVAKHFLKALDGYQG